MILITTSEIEDLVGAWEAIAKEIGRASSNQYQSHTAQDPHVMITAALLLLAQHVRVGTTDYE